MTSASGASAQDAARVSLKALVDSPKDYLEKPIRIPALGCVDDPKGGFICIEIVGGQALRIEASGLGASTPQRIAERLIGDCKGTANLSSPACRVEVRITPRSAYRDTIETPRGSQPVTVVYSGLIDMYDVKRR